MMNITNDEENLKNINVESATIIQISHSYFLKANIIKTFFCAFCKILHT